MATFASAEDIAGRLPRALTAAESAQLDTLLELATLAVAEAVDKDQDWADALSPVPPALRLICIELVRRALDNPTGAASVSETLGAYSHAESFDTSQAGSGMEPTASEGRRIRRAVYGRNSGSGRADTIASHVGVNVLDELFLDEDVIVS